MVWTNECCVSVTLVCWLRLGVPDNLTAPPGLYLNQSKEDDGPICFKDCSQPKDDDISIVG